MLVDISPGVVSVLKVRHLVLPSGHKNLSVLEETDLKKYQEENIVDENFCKKNKESQIQMKFSCCACRKVIESVTALNSHLVSGKHLENSEKPIDNSEFSLENGKWRKIKGIKRPLDVCDKLSKREQTKKNKIARSIPILPQHTDAKYDETETYFENGLRKVRPYYFTFTTHAKGRWVGDKLSDVFAREFRAMEPKDYLRCIEEGLIKVNDKKSSIDYQIENNDFISHTVHRHELPVTDQKIKIIKEDEDWLVVDKPASIPVHPCGRYRHNSVIFILAKEHGMRNIHTVHRLDRLTSGVLIFSKTAAKARHMEQVIKAREVQKEYVCRVVGEFPDGEIICDQPIEVISYKIGLCVVDPLGKDCRTTFQKLDFKNGFSIVKCWPKTGRMHQLRVHLQYLGFPIANDPLYNSDIFGPNKGKGGDIGKSREQLVEDLIEYHTVENWINSDEYEASLIKPEKEVNTNNEINDTDNGLSDAPSVGNDEKLENGNGIITTNYKIEVREEASSEELFYDPHCGECKIKYKEPPPATLVMYLHALKYSGDGWSYQTDLPAWAKI